ncbi:MAG: alpha/beta hydrolase [Phenylobacterium sp.]
MTQTPKFVDTPSGRIAYAEQGQGPVALFVHGVLVNSHIWRHQLAALSDIRRCIAVDLLGHGHTEAAAGQDVSSVAQAAMLAQVLDALGVDSVDLVGNDGGAAVAQLFAVAHPGRVRSLVITNGDVHDNWPPQAFQGFVDMCAAGGLPDTLAAMAQDKAIYRSAGALGPCYEDPSQVSDATIDAYLQPYLANPDRLRDLARFVAAFDNRQTTAIEGQLRDLQIPSLVVWGDDDVYFDRKWGRWLKDTLPAARRLVELQGARLFFPEERPEAFNREVRLHWSEVG